jgi:hypothetical protein
VWLCGDLLFEQENYNLTVESVVERVAAKLKGEAVPGVCV